MSNEFVVGDFYITNESGGRHWDHLDKSNYIVYIYSGGNHFDTTNLNCAYTNGDFMIRGIRGYRDIDLTNLKFHEYFIDFLNPTSTELSLHYLEFGIETEQLKTFLQEAYEMHHLLKEYLEKEKNK